MPLNEKNLLYKKGIENLFCLPESFVKDEFSDCFFLIASQICM